MRKLLVFVVGICLASASWAGCKPLSCQRLTELKAERCGADEPCPLVPPCAPCVPEVVVQEVEKLVYRDVPTPFVVYKEVEPQGYWGAGAGAMYFHGIGATIVGSYTMANGLQFVGGPFYIPQNSTPGYTGTTTNCPGRSGLETGNNCRTLPYTVPTVAAKDPLGAQFLLIYNWR